MFDYAFKAAIAWFLGFFPFFEIYVAVPAAIAMGLDYPSAVFWTVLGNFLPVPLIVFFYGQLVRLRRIGPWLQGLASPRAKGLLDRHGPWFILLATPWIGVWAVAVTAMALGMNQRNLLLFTLISISVYAIVLAGLIAFGIQAVQPQSQGVAHPSDVQPPQFVEARHGLTLAMHGQLSV
jgi:uncharacterized membrane protein